jgi:hypothetical protein
VTENGFHFFDIFLTPSVMTQQLKMANSSQATAVNFIIILLTAFVAVDLLVHDTAYIVNY